MKTQKVDTHIVHFSGGVEYSLCPKFRLKKDDTQGKTYESLSKFIEFTHSCLKISMTGVIWIYLNYSDPEGPQMIFSEDETQEKPSSLGDLFHYVTPTGMSYLFYYTEQTPMVKYE